MNLREFLATASADHNQALQEAQAYTTTEPNLYTANVLTVMLVEAGVYGALADVADTQGHPVRDICLALMDRLRSEGGFNLSPSHPMGQANIGMLDVLIAGLPDYAVALTGLKNQLIAGSETSSQPFANVTLYSVLQARNAMPTVPVTHNEQGFVLVTTSAPVPLHSPSIAGLNPRTNKWQVVGRMNSVETAGTYECRIDHPHRGWALKLEDAYGVME